jgi:hypothetical protein
MQIQNYDYKITFGVKLKPVEIIEAATSTVIQSENIEGIKNVVNAFHPKTMKATGFRGYKYYANQYANIICDKHPELSMLAEVVRKLKSENPYIKKSEIYAKIKPKLKLLGEEIDVNI